MGCVSLGDAPRRGGNERLRSGLLDLFLPPTLHPWCVRRGSSHQSCLLSPTGRQPAA